MAIIVCIFFFLVASSNTAHGQQRLSHKFYSRSCPGVQPLVRATVEEALRRDPTLGASILRLFFHDCFVNVRTRLLLQFDRAQLSLLANADL